MYYNPSRACMPRVNEDKICGTAVVSLTTRAHDKTGEEEERVTPIIARTPGRIFITYIIL